MSNTVMVSRTVGLLMMTVSTLLGLAGAEAAVRWVDGGVFSQIDRYRETGGAILLEPSVTVRLRAGDGSFYTLETDSEGLRDCAVALPEARRGDAGTGWLVAGDSQIVGMGVPAAETWCAVARAMGARVWPVGVPGHGVADALSHAAALLPAHPGAGVAIVVNDSNDWPEVGTLATDRLAVVNGWLLEREDVATLRGRFLGSPASRSHFLMMLAQLALHDFSQDPRSRRLADSPFAMDSAHLSRAAGTLAANILEFHQRWPDVPLVVVHLPVDFSTSLERAQEALPPEVLDGLTAPFPWEPERSSEPWLAVQAGLPGVRMLDVAPGLSDPASWLPGDYHLSAVGHQALADALLAGLTSP